MRTLPAESTASDVPEMSASVSRPKLQMWSPVAHSPDAQLPGAHSMSGSVPTSCGVHVPSLPERLQASQVASQAEVQQRPSVQKPLVHSFEAVQGSPSGLVPVPPELVVVEAPVASLAGPQVRRTSQSELGGHAVRASAITDVMIRVACRRNIRGSLPDPRS